MRKRPKILNVDDDEIGRFAITHMLRSAGFEVDEAASGHEALAKAESLPDIMLLDVRMPDLDGFEVCKRIKSDARTAGITVIHMSATEIDSQSIVDGLDWGADGYLTEPITQSELIATLRAFLRIRQSESAQRFLANVTSVLSGVLEADQVLDQLAPLAVAFCGELCLVDKLDEHGGLRPLAAARAQLVGPSQALHCARSLVDGEEVSVVARVAATGKPAIDTGIADAAQLARALGIADAAQVADLVPAAYLSVPLCARSRSLGVITIVSRASERQYGPRDLALLEDLAARSALLVDNARLYEQAQKAIATRENLLAVVSHDLKDPLNSLVMGCEVMRESTTDPLARKRLEIMRRAARRMDHLIHDLLDLASLDRGTFSVTREPCGLEALVDEVTDQFQATALERSIAFAVHTCGPFPPLSCDRDRIYQVLSNLLSNAMKFTGRGGRVELRVEVRDGAVVFQVSDTGSGIAPAQLAHVFDRFWQANRERRLGVGLGLSIAKGIVDAHGGTISVRSAVGQGSTFEVVLPAGPLSASSA